MENKNQEKGKPRKRPKSPGSARSTKRRTATQDTRQDVAVAVKSSNESDTSLQVQEKKQSQELPCFKNSVYRETGFATRTKVWKNLKQIMASQKSQCSPAEVTYASIDAPPPSKPVKKYSDLSGLPALYTDPHTKLRYSNSDEYRKIQHISSDTVVGLLALRHSQYSR